MIDLVTDRRRVAALIIRDRHVLLVRERLRWVRLSEKASEHASHSRCGTSPRSRDGPKRRDLGISLNLGHQEQMARVERDWPTISETGHGSSDVGIGPIRLQSPLT